MKGNVRMNNGILIVGDMGAEGKGKRGQGVSAASMQVYSWR